MEFENVKFGNELTASTHWAVVRTVNYDKKLGWYFDTLEEFAQSHRFADDPSVHFMLDKIEIYPV